VRIHGRDHYLGRAGCWSDSRKKPPAQVVEEYHRLIAQFTAARAENRPVLAPGHHLTLNELALAYRAHCLKWYRKRGRVTSQVALIGRAVREVLVLFGSTLAADFAPRDLRTVRDRLERGGKHNRDVINGHVRRIRLMFRWGAEQELIPEEIWLRLKAVSSLVRGRSSAREPGKVMPVADKLVDALLPHLSPVIQAIVRVQRMTGMRPCEVCGMRLGDVQPVADVWRYTVRDEHNKMAHKGIARVVWWGPKTNKIVKPWLEAARRGGTDAPVFPLQNGTGQMSVMAYRGAIYSACKRRGLEQFAPNQLRHTRATEIRQYFGLEGSQVTLGHESIQTTEIYAEKSEELAKRIARETS
jgi:integrase